MRETEETNHISETVLVSFSDVEAILTDTSKDILSFSGLDIFVKEQTVYKDGLLIPLSYYEFFTLYFLAQYTRWVFSKKQILKQYGNSLAKNVRQLWQMSSAVSGEN